MRLKSERFRVRIPGAKGRRNRMGDERCRILYKPWNSQTRNPEISQTLQTLKPSSPKTKLRDFFRAFGQRLAGVIEMSTHRQ